MDVRSEVLTVSDIAGSGGRLRSKRPTSSSAKFCASQALPPLPKERILLPRLYAAMSASAAFSSRTAFFAVAARVLLLSRSSDAIRDRSRAIQLLLALHL